MIPIHTLTPQTLETWQSQNATYAEWVTVNRFRAEAGSTLLVPHAHGGLSCVLLGLGQAGDPRCAGVLSTVLPAGAYTLDLEDPMALLAYRLGAYRFDAFKQDKPSEPAITLQGADHPEIERLVASITMVRDMVNMPANEMHPEALQKRVEAVGQAYGASVHTIIGDDLLTHNFPLIHAVGKGSAIAPRLIELTWGQNPSAPLVTLVGKGVCFDTGGLDIKTASGMAIMKKDMGGAACALALAQLIMDAGLPVRLKLLIPAVENSISGVSYRPGDIIKSRKGLSVEIGNTDAEGRLILADALAYGGEDEPAYLIDFATLTGAARIALGPDLPAFFTPHDDVAQSVQTACAAVRDDVWRMPLWQPYLNWLKTGPADMNNVTENGYAGTIVAALFLQQFVPPAVTWMHFDLYAWRSTPTFWCPKGGEAYVIRGLYRFLTSIIS